MFQLYLLLRLKNFGRIVIELGIFRIVFLTILTVAAIMILFMAVRHVIAFPERNEAGTQTYPLTFSLQRKL